MNQPNGFYWVKYTEEYHKKYRFVSNDPFIVEVSDGAFLQCGFEQDGDIYELVFIAGPLIPPTDE